MKKTICLMLSVLLTLSLSGCANNDTPKEKAALYKAGTVTGTAQGMERRGNVRRYENIDNSDCRRE